MKKTLTMVLAMVLVAAISVSATLAYLTAQTNDIVNTFTFGGISMKLTETYEQNSKIYPGAVIDKTPVVTIDAKSENCYAYAMIDNKFTAEEATLDIDTQVWVPVKTVDTKTIYRYNAVVAYDKADQALPALFTKVSINGEKVTSANIEDVAANTITIDAYAHQATGEGITVEIADAAAIAHWGMAN